MQTCHDCISLPLHKQWLDKTWEGAFLGGGNKEGRSLCFTQAFRQLNDHQTHWPVPSGRAGGKTGQEPHTCGGGREEMALEQWVLEGWGEKGYVLGDTCLPKTCPSPFFWPITEGWEGSRTSIPDEGRSWFSGTHSFSKSNGRVLILVLPPQIFNPGRIININRVIVVIRVFWQIKDGYGFFDILLWHAEVSGSSWTRVLCYCFEGSNMVEGQGACSQARAFRDSSFYFQSPGTLTLGTPSHMWEPTQSAGETTWRGVGAQRSPAFPRMWVKSSWNLQTGPVTHWIPPRDPRQYHLEQKNYLAEPHADSQLSSPCPGSWKRILTPIWGAWPATIITLCYAGKAFIFGTSDLMKQALLAFHLICSEGLITGMSQICLCFFCLHPSVDPFTWLVLANGTVADVSDASKQRLEKPWSTGLTFS